MKESGDSDYDIVIIECCENCQTHQNFARHSEWKYFQQFNELKRKVERFINNAIVIKNPVPDELIKTPEIKNEKNIFFNKHTNEKIIFPRIGSFEIYMYNVLISSKLMTNQWPNHYKILQALAKMIEEKKKGNSLDHFSVYYQGGLDSQPTKEIERETSKEKESPERRNHRIVSKKKKKDTGTAAAAALANKTYKTIDRAYETMRDARSTLQPLSSKLLEKQQLQPAPRAKKINRYLQSKADTRVKLPSLGNSLNLRQDSFNEKKTPNKKIFNNSIEQLDKQDLSIIERKVSADLTEGHKISILDLKSNEEAKNSVSLLHDHHEELKFLENRSVQYSEQNDPKELMNRSIQYEEEEGYYCDFGLQIDDGLITTKQINVQFVQTEKIELMKDPPAKVYMLDENIQANIQIKVPSDTQETQTIIKQFVDENLGTEIVSMVSRAFQFPEENPKLLNQNQIVDTTFVHLFEKRRNMVDNEAYSIDRFEQKSSKYKWIGRSNLNEHPDDLKKKLFLECLVFSVYNYYGIKTPQKRLSYQQCSNVVGEKIKDGALHIMTFDNPELQYLFQFEQCNREQQKYPLSELITFRASKQLIKFNNYGGLLALAYFLNDYEIFNQGNNQIGLVIVNEAIKEIHKLSSLNYQIHPNTKNTEDEIIVDPNGEPTIKLNRLSQAVELQFFSMLARISDSQTFEELIKYIRQIFIHTSSTYQQFKSTIFSLRLEKPENETVEDFINMLEKKVIKVRQIFKGKLYTYSKYHTLTPKLKYSIPFEYKIERKLKYKEKLVTPSDVIKHIRNKDHIVIVEGEDGMGKSTLLAEMAKQLKETDKMNVLEFNWLRKEQNRVKDELFQLTKNIIFIDNVELFEPEVMELIEKNKKTNFQISYCMATSKSKQGEVFKNYFGNLTIVETELLPFGVEQIRNYSMKVVKYKSYTAKKDIVDKVLQRQRYINILQNPFYLTLFSSFLSRSDLQNFQIRDKDITKYSLLKQHFSECTTTHNEQMKSMNIKIKDTLPNLRRLAFQYFHSNREVNDIIKDILTPYEQNELIRSQMVYYPINLDSTITSSYQPLFCHNLFLNYFLVEAYSYFIEKGYRNLHMDRLYRSRILMDIITERYKIEQTHSQLVQVIYSSKKFKNICEGSSNALTLLCRMGYVFSNMNFDDCIISEADLSNAIFYQCSFRGTDLQQAVLYKSQMISCIFDNALMSRINLYSKKYEIEFTAMTASLSADGKRIAYGCGNYLIVLNAETGAQMKRIEAHLDVIRLVKYGRDGNSLITVADDKTLRIWDVFTYKSVVFKLPQKGSINYSNETETIASVNKNNLKVWNLKSMANEAELEGHTDAITTVQFSFDGNLILTGSKDTTLRLWTLKGKQKIVYKGHQSQILAGKLSPVNRTMVSSSKDKDIIMWQTETGNKIISKKFMNEITEICLDNKQKYIIITYNNDNHIVILDFITMDIIHALGGHQAKIISMSFDHNFQQLISLGKDRTSRIWQFDKIMDIETRNPKIVKKIFKGQVLALAFDKMNQKYATSHENGQINIWRAEDNELIDQVFSHNGAVKCLTFDKSGKLYSGGSDGNLRIWQLEAKRQPRNIQTHSSEMVQLKLSQKNRLIATSSLANQLVIHDFTGIKIVMSTREDGRLNTIEFSPDEKRMAVGGTEKYIVLYEIANGNTVTRGEELGPHTDTINSLCFFGQSMLVCALKNGQVAIWNHIKSNMVKKIENVSPIRSIIQFQKKYICFTSEDGKVRIINMDEGKQLRVFRYSEFPTAIDTNSDESLLYVGTNMGNIIKWNLNVVQPPRKRIEFDRKAIDADCTKIVTVESGTTLLIKDLFYHRQELIEVKVDSDIEGVTFDENRIIMLLKNGKYWEFGKRQYKFNTAKYNQGDLFFIRDKNFTNFYRSGIKKIKGMNKPTLTILEEVNS